MSIYPLSYGIIIIHITYIIKLFAPIYLYVYMLAIIAGHTAGLNGLTFFEGTLGVLG